MCSIQPSGLGVTRLQLKKIKNIYLINLQLPPFKGKTDNMQSLTAHTYIKHPKNCNKIIEAFSGTVYYVTLVILLNILVVLESPEKERVYSNV